MKKLAYLLALMSGLALAAGSTVNPTIPVANSPLQSAPIRGNFAATASDINSLIQINAGTTAPATPLLGQQWLNTTATPYVWNVFDGAVWDILGTLNASTNKFQAGSVPWSGVTGTPTTLSGYGITNGVSSVGVTMPSAFSCTGSPVTSSGTVACVFAAQSQAYFLASPAGATGTPLMRQIAATDIPTLNQNTTGNAATVTTNANLTGDVTSVGNATTIAPTGVTAGTYAQVTVNAKGQATAGVALNTVPFGGTGVGSISGIVKGVGTGPFVTATAGTDYVAPGASSAQLNFVQAGTGAVTQTVQGKLAQSTSLEDFGGSPSASGSVNATALQAAVTYACANNTVLHILGYTYTITPYQAETDLSGTNYATALMCSGLSVTGDMGATLKVSNGTSTSGSPINYSIFFSNVPLSKIAIRGITFDLNGANNTISPSAPASYNNYTTAAIIFSGGGSGSSAAAGTDITVDHCEFLNAPGVSSIVTAQSNTAGVTIGTHWTITNNLFYNNGLNSNDHSSIYGWANDVVVTGNIFDNPTMSTGYPAIGPHVAYEVHGSNQIFSNNFVNNYYQMAWVADNYTSQTKNVVISNNLFTVSGVGVNAFYESAAEYGINGVSVEGNTCYITDDTVTQYSGVKSCFQITTGYGVENFKYSGNRGYKLGTTNTAYFFYTQSSGIAANVNDGITLSDNEARYFAGGVFIGTNSTNGYGSLSILNNKFIDMTPSVGVTGTAGVNGINIGTQPVKTLTMSGNVFENDSAVSYLYGIYLSGSITNLVNGPESYIAISSANYTEGGLTLTNRLPTYVTTLAASGQISSTVSTGTAPLVVASTTNVANLNASSLNGATFASPGAIGGTTASTIKGTTITATGNITNAGTVGTSISAGQVSYAGNATSGQGGELRLLNDAGTSNWLVGLLGSAGATNFSIYDLVNSASRITINSSTGVVTAGVAVSTPLYEDSGGRVFLSSTAPTLASGGCASAAMTTDNSTAYFTATNSGTCTGSQPMVFTLPAAAHSWHCTARDVTTPGQLLQTGAISTTSVTITNYALTTGLAQAWTTGDVVEVSCMGG